MLVQSMPYGSDSLAVHHASKYSDLSKNDQRTTLVINHNIGNHNLSVLHNAFKASGLSRKSTGYLVACLLMSCCCSFLMKPQGLEMVF